MSYPAKYPPAVNPANWNAMVDAVKGVTVDGVRSYPLTYIIRSSGGEYEVINSVHNLVYGGTSDAGGIDGSDPQAVIQAAFTNISSGAIYILKGTYALTSVCSLTSKTDVAIILEKGAKLSRGDTGSSYHLLDVTGCTNFILEGGEIDGEIDDTTEAVGSYLSNSLHLEDCKNASVRNVLFTKASDDGIWVEDCDQVLIEGCFFDDFYKHAVGVVSTGLADKSNDIRIIGNVVDGHNDQYYDGLTVYGYSTGGVTITGNTCRNLDSAVAADHSGIHVEDPNATPDNSVITITGNTVIDSKYGITTATCRPVTIVGNSIYDTSSAGIFLFGPVDITCTSNTIQTSAKGIYAVHGANINLSHNTITDITGIGIHLHQTGGNAMYESIIHGNTLENITGDGIYSNNSFHLNISNNILKKIGENGISTLMLLKSVIEGNVIIDASQTTNNTYYSIKLSGAGGSSYYVTVTNNHCYSIAANKAKYHIYVDSDCNNLHITFNMLNGAVTGNLSCAATATLIRFNKGYVNEKNGVGVITSGTALATVDPDFDASIDFTAAAPRVLLTGQANAEVTQLYWSVKNADEIYVAVPANTTDNRYFNYFILAANAIES